MPPATLYLDTSVVGGYFDKGWETSTIKLWQLWQEGTYGFATSVITLAELERAPQRVKQLFNATFVASQLLRTSPESEELTEAYLKQQVLSRKYADDARHVAICTVAQIDYLASWNFRHLLDDKRGTRFNLINASFGYAEVEIYNPWELTDEIKYRRF